ncbi:MAG: tripartite tricarboxylate transporter permease [Armatimonadota bacterium]|nr:tripartite tricarboxylate transporter permease [Armatimonadota bacterium]MDW8156968.1 tripartite tricarboxylate transporter permease [Armatimonadota bacterium]
MTEAVRAAVELFVNPSRLGMLAVGSGVGLLIGMLPGMGGIVAAAILLPFMLKLEPAAALAMVTGALAVVHTSDTITSVLIGAPGSAAAVPTMMEGHPMARRGEAARALAAAYLSSLVGGLIGALGLTLSIPIARPLVLSFGSPELFMLTVLGVSFAGSLLGKQPVKGLSAGLLGLLLGTVGPAPAAAEVRFAFGQVYLTDGIDLALVALGLFGVAEVVSLMARGGAVAQRTELGHGWWEGVRDVWRHRWLVLRGALIGMWAGVLPAIGATAGTLMAYGHAVATSRDRSRFGKGDVRGIIAPEAANNAVEAGDLVPTLLFGVPGGAPSAMILGALLAYGILPGPRIVTQHLDLIYTVVWSFALANVFGAGVMFAASPLLARLTSVPFHRIAPPIVLAMVLAAYQETQHFGDLVALVALGVVGYALKVTGWPRGPLLIGFVLSNPLERYYFLTVRLHPDPVDWLLRPGVMVIGLLVVAPFAWSAVRWVRARSQGAAPVARQPAGPATVATAAVLAVFAYAWWESRGFLPDAALMPVSVAAAGTVLTALQLVRELGGYGGPVEEEDELAAQDGGAGRRVRRAAGYLLSLVVYVAATYFLGLRWASALWSLWMLRAVARLGWPGSVAYTAAMVLGLELLASVLGVHLPRGRLGL